MTWSNGYQYVRVVIAFFFGAAKENLMSRILCLICVLALCSPAVAEQLATRVTSVFEFGEISAIADKVYINHDFDLGWSMPFNSVGEVEYDASAIPWGRTNPTLDLELLIYSSNGYLYRSKARMDNPVGTYQFVRPESTTTVEQLLALPSNGDIYTSATWEVLGVTRTPVEVLGQFNWTTKVTLLGRYYAVPEPSSWLLLVTGSVAIGWVRPRH